MLPSEFIKLCRTKHNSDAEIAALKAIAREINRRVNIEVCYVTSMYPLPGFTIKTFKGGALDSYSLRAIIELSRLDAEVRDAS